MTKQPKTIQEMMTLLVEERGLDITGFSEFRLILLMAIIAFEMERTLRIS